MVTAAPPATDPAIYAEHYAAFKRASQPSTAADWIARAAAVKDILAKDAGQRERDNKTPRAEIALLKASALTKILGPRRLGGGGQPWSVGYKAIREVAKSDGSIGMLLGYHLLWSTTASVVGTDAQKENIQRLILENNFFIGGAVNPRDSDLKITTDAEGLVFDGFKNFNTGGVISDLTVLEGAVAGSDAHVFTFVRTEQPGIQFSYNWDNIGLRLSESGSVRIANVRVPWSDALGWDPATKQPDASVLGIPFATLLLPTIQLVFSNFYLGITLGALDYAAEYTRTRTRAWPYGGDNKDKAVDEFYILERYGEFRAHADAAEALADVAGDAVSKLYADAAAADHGSLNGAANGSANGYANGHAAGGDIELASTRGRASITREYRGQVAERVATVKIVTTDTGLAVTSGIYEVLGASASARKYGFDRFWRDIRTHSLHDPVAYKKKEVGLWTVTGQIPEPTWYT